MEKLLKHWVTGCCLFVGWFKFSFYVFCVPQVSDTGQYVCMATNIAGQVDKNFHLNIYGMTSNI